MKLLSMLAASLMLSRSYAVDDSDPAAAPIAPDVALTPAQAAAEAAPATATLDVPVAHVSLLERVATLLREAEQDIVDNVEAGINYLESLWKDRQG